MTGSQIFALLAVMALLAFLVLACLGWLTAMPDGSDRYRRRLWAAICGTAYVFLSFDAVEHPRWWLWVYMCLWGGFGVNRVGHWWRAVEAARKQEAAFPWRVR